MSNENDISNSIFTEKEDLVIIKIKEDYQGIILNIITTSFPLILIFLSLSLTGTFILFLLSNKPLQMIEGFSLTLLYFNCFIIGIFWGGTFGYQILGSEALGKGDKEIIHIYHNQMFISTLILSVLICLFSIFVTPYLLGLLNPDPLALGYLKELMVSFSPAIITFSIVQIYMRLTNIIQKTIICLVASLCGCILQSITVYILLKIYNSEIYSIGIGYSINFIFMMGFLHIYFKKFEKNKILKNGLSISKLSFNTLITLLKLGIVPMINYLLFLISIESISFYGFMINDESFTIMTIFMNILSVIVVISEAVACSMSSLISFSISNNKNHIVYKIFRSGLFLSALIQICFLGILNIFPNEILSIFFEDHELINLANKEIYFFSIGISMNSFHFILCEYIIVNGNHSVPLYSLLFGKLIIQNLLAYFLTPLLGLSGIILSMNIGEFVCIVIFIIYINFYMKTNISLIDDSDVYVINE